MCIRDRARAARGAARAPKRRARRRGLGQGDAARDAVSLGGEHSAGGELDCAGAPALNERREKPVSYTHLRAHETVLDLVCRLLLEKKKHIKQ